MSGRVLLLAPSRGLGGGIERYVSTIESAFSAHAVTYHRFDLRTDSRPSRQADKLRFLRDVTLAARASSAPVRLVLAHRNLLPVVPLAARFGQVSNATVILHGRDIWTERNRGARLMRRADVRVVAVSNFSAGAISAVCPATVLSPGLSGAWFDTLVSAADRPRPVNGHLDVLTVFRLHDWRDKGLPTLLDAIRLLANDRVRLTVCGRGPVPAELAALAATYPWCAVVPDPNDDILAARIASADLFVLATRTRYGRAPSGEGFGLVLLEAQVAGVPVVAPAYGGSGDAFQPGLTGVAPLDETASALAAALRPLLDDGSLRMTMGRAAAAWSRSRFHPTLHGHQVVRALVGDISAVFDSVKPGGPPEATAIVGQT
jgi:phosphatidylinositol alpha-1,6-mannosyltransferase